MTKFRIIGNMTGNSMDAIDLVLTEFDGDVMTDICTFTRPYSSEMQKKIEKLRALSHDKTATEIERLPEFRIIHDEYISQIADCINEMCRLNNIDKTSLDAIGFHGKTLDHNPPSKARLDGSSPYTLQIGSGQMLADLTGISVVYDFRSDPLMAGFDGAPLVPAHNAHISSTEGDGLYYNGGNTSNFAIIHEGKTLFGSDAGPFNEYTDNFIRQQSNFAFDKDGQLGCLGTINFNLLQYLFAQGCSFYETPLPKSGDPAYYHKDTIFQHICDERIPFYDAVRTFEYFAAYIAALTLSLTPSNIDLPSEIILFGGGWKNPIVRQDFENFLFEKNEVLPQHCKAFEALSKRFIKTPRIRFSRFGEYMEARLLADLARYKLENKPWDIPEIRAAEKSVICGVIAHPQSPSSQYSDRINRAAKGWQNI